jgi:dipeptidyl aminopeptidase/acylaminoacyl peptidase
MVTPVIALLLAASSASRAVPSDVCRAYLLPQTGQTKEERLVSAVDIATLRDFGSQEATVGGAPPFSISPDGRKAAVVLRRADPERDGYCFGLVIIPLDGRSAIRTIDTGGEPILERSDVRGIADLPIGNVEPVTPLWSPDGRSLAYLRRDEDRTRAWVARADGSGARPVSPVDLEARGVRWSEDDTALLVRTRPGLVAANAEIEREGRVGFLYDRRFWPLSHPSPSPSASLSEVDQRIALDGRAVAGAEPRPAGSDGRPAHAVLYSRSPGGARAWTAPDDPALVMGSATLRASMGGRTVSCRSELCRRTVGALWWQGDDTLVFLTAPKAENGGTTVLARWRPAGRRDPVVVLATNDALFGCQSALKTIVCAHEAPSQPRTLVSVDVRMGRLAVVYDPNPEFRSLRKGTVTRLRWKDDDGVASYGDLVLPPDHRSGTRHPLVIVQYRSRGFLRGGTGDEYPVHALASRGFAVLSVERPEFVGAGKARNFAEFMRLSVADFAERRRVLSSIETGIRMAIARGAVAPQRIGITGVSDGAATVQFALVNTNLFSAAAVSSCCDEPSSTMFAADRGYGDMLVDAGFPEPGSDGRPFWQHYSLAANASRLTTPLLMQLTEDEFRFGLETYVTLDRHRVPVELYVYPDGYHQKWRPSQRLASYERALDWFDFWLEGKIDPAPQKAAQYERWRALRDRQDR